MKKIAIGVCLGVDFDTLGHELLCCGSLWGFDTFMIICSQNAILCEISIFDYVEALINYGFAHVSPKTHKKMNSSRREVHKTMID